MLSGVLKRPGLKRDTGVWDCSHEAAKLDGKLRDLRPISYSSCSQGLQCEEKTHSACERGLSHDVPNPWHVQSDLQP